MQDQSIGKTELKWSVFFVLFGVMIDIVVFNENLLKRIFFPKTQNHFEIGRLSENSTPIQRKPVGSYRWETMFKDELLLESDTVFADSESRAVIELKNGQKLNLQPNSMMTLSLRNNLLFLNLFLGELDIQLKANEKLKILENGEVIELKGATKGNTLKLSKSGMGRLIIKAQEEGLKIMQGNLALETKFANSEYVLRRLSESKSMPIEDSLMLQIDPGLEMEFSEEEFPFLPEISPIPQAVPLPNQEQTTPPPLDAKEDANSLNRHDDEINSLPPVLPPEVDLPVVVEPEGDTHIITGNKTLSFVIQLDPARGATHYRFQIATDDRFENLIEEVVVENPKHIFSRELNERTVYFRVKGENSVKQSPWTKIQKIHISTVEDED
jgi:hypothetical protein